MSLDPALSSVLGMYPGRPTYTTLPAAEEVTITLSKNYFAIALTNREGLDEIFYIVDPVMGVTAELEGDRSSFMVAGIGTVYEWSLAGGDVHTKVSLYSETAQKICIQGLHNDPQDADNERMADS